MRLDAIPDENLYTKIDEDLATNNEASIQDIVSNVLNSNAEGSDDEDDSECEKKSVSTSDALKAIDDLRCFFTNSEAADEHLKAIRDLEKVVLTTKKRDLGALNVDGVVGEEQYKLGVPGISSESETGGESLGKSGSSLVSS
ncbi:hypothetical protein AVEN_152805-1 [Araneus ventricosus]|uniref:Uncharacterized protein n=1 Tax=Araneus ventricosus TaxID=182803 RepID=A0A4Y2LIC1_ARAVE|nr:hypothetical protein AVEN_152805-1 [Araneus ventricosus]